MRISEAGTNPKMAFLRAHKRLTAIAVSWVLFFAFWLIPNLGEGPFYFVLFSALWVILIGSQFFWIRRVVDLGERFIPGKPRRAWLTAIATTTCLFLFAYNSTSFLPRDDSTHLTLRRALFEVPFAWWFVGSMAGFGLVIIFWTVDRISRAAAWAYRRARKAAAGRAADSMSGATALDPRLLSRRRMLEQTAVSLSAAPFVAAAYGLLYGRRDVEVTRLRIALAHLPSAFEGFLIAQLSDIHIGPFMTAEQIRRYVTMANGLKAELVVLTGDFVSDDGTAEGDEVVRALQALKAPFGVFGCLGNHEIYTETEDSITRLLAAQGIRILRQERAVVESHGDTLNLIGIDYQSVPGSRDHAGHVVERYLAGSEALVMPGVVNILLSHNPNAFDRAAELGIDLTLAGHTHGGQLSLEFVHRGLSLASLQTPYPSGWFEKPGGQQLYVNRGIGTTGFPIRFGSRPEITILELVRRA
jgi:predicted MPP superfamily phosphohydrolase